MVMMEIGIWMGMAYCWMLQEMKDELMNEPVTAEHFEMALRNVSSSVSKNDLEKFQNWMDEYGSV